MEKEKPFKVHPLWFFMAIFGVVLVLGVLAFFGFTDTSSYRSELRATMMILYIPVCLYYIPRCMWGYGLDRAYFTIYILWFPVQRIPWDEVSQVVYVHLGKNAQKKSATWKKEYILVTIKPADSAPFFYHEELGKHWRRNLFLVWNLYFTSPEIEGPACIKAFEALGKTVEHREYD